MARPRLGWDEALLEQSDAQFCDLPRVSVKGLTAGQIHTTVFGMGVPVVITDAIDNWKAMKMWTRPGLLQHYGDVARLALDVEVILTPPCIFH